MSDSGFTGPPGIWYQVLASGASIVPGTRCLIPGFASLNFLGNGNLTVNAELSALDGRFLLGTPPFVYNGVVAPANQPPPYFLTEVRYGNYVNASAMIAAAPIAQRPILNAFFAQCVSIKGVEAEIVAKGAMATVDGSVLWELLSTGASSNSILSLQPNGDLQLYSAPAGGALLWATSWVVGPQALVPGSFLALNAGGDLALVSPTAVNPQSAAQSNIPVAPLDGLSSATAIGPIIWHTNTDVANWA